MASSWTVVLTYQAVSNFAAALEQAPAGMVGEADKLARDLQRMAESIRKDFNRYMQLLYPDGVRLMNRPAQYDGGVSTHFKRAEHTANFEREVGLQYVHAHIRKY